jgi:hypothetical protein
LNERIKKQAARSLYNFVGNLMQKLVKPSAPLAVSFLGGVILARCVVFYER